MGSSSTIRILVPMGSSRGGGEGSDRSGERQRHLGAAIQPLALHDDGAPHVFDQSLRDRKSEAGSLMAPVVRGIGLRELREEPGFELARDADAGVLDRHACLLGFGVAPRAHPYFSSIGKF